MLQSVRKWRDPELESLRNQAIITSKPNNDIIFQNLVRKTKFIHVSFLFGPEGTKALRKICLPLSSTESENKPYSGWEDFGINLGLDPLVIKLFSKGYFGQDPTYHVLQVYAQEENGTLDKIIEVLKKINRPDVITKANDAINRLVDDVLRKYGNSEESGYFSFSEGTAESTNECSEDDIQQSILKSPYVPSVPFIFKKDEPTQERISSYENQTICHMKDTEQKERTSPHIVTKDKVHKYGLKVMLTYASDGIKEAQEIAKVMRTEREGLPRIGVLVLQEQQQHADCDRQLFVEGAFHQVDYVIPIITEKYLKSATSVNFTESGIDCLDAKYVRYIYSLMNSTFLANGCLNDKFRCIIPDKLLQAVLRHPLMTGPLFQVWIKLSETENLSRRLLIAKLRKK